VGGGGGGRRSGVASWSRLVVGGARERTHAGWLGARSAKPDRRGVVLRKEPQHDRTLRTTQAGDDAGDDDDAGDEADNGPAGAGHVVRLTMLRGRRAEVVVDLMCMVDGSVASRPRPPALPALPACLSAGPPLSW